MIAPSGCAFLAAHPATIVLCPACARVEAAGVTELTVNLVPGAEKDFEQIVPTPKQEPPLNPKKTKLEAVLDDLFIQARRNLLPKIEGSAITVLPFDGAAMDLKVALEVGVTLLFGKPLLVIVMQGSEPPMPALVRAADVIVELTAPMNTDESKAKVAAGIEAALALGESYKAKREARRRAREANN